MDLKLQPKPEIEIEPANRGIVSREKFFVKKVTEKINRYFFPGQLARNWKPKAELIYPTVSNEEEIGFECHFNRDVQNCFVEDQAEEVYLRSPPPCFVVLGKPGPEVGELSREIAGEYGSVLIPVEEVVLQAINSDTESGRFTERILRFGSSANLNFVLALICCLAHTAEARHRGYVLSGLPCLPLGRDLSAEQQLNYLFSWENKPTVFVHVLYEDEDLVRSRSLIRYEIGNPTENETVLMVRRSRAVEDTKEGEEDTESDSSSDEGEPDIDVSPSRPWIQLQKDKESVVWTELESFERVIKPALDLLTCRVDPQYFITVDSRVRNRFEIVKSRLSLLQIWKTPLPFPFIEPKDAAEEEEPEEAEEEGNVTGEGQKEVENDPEDVEIGEVAHEPPEIAFLTFFSKKTISPKFRWELSHYNYTCPVSLRAGEVTEGKSRFAVAFMKYIYFLRDEESMRTFLKNPRPFVLPIRPKPPSRFILVGYPYCGKTALARSLAQEFSIPLINLNSILKKDLEEKKNAFLDFCREKAESREIVRLTAQAWRDWRMEEEQRVSLTEEWIEFIQSLLCQRIEQFYSSEREKGSGGGQIGSSSSGEQAGEDGEEEVEEDGGESKRSRKKKRSKGLEIKGVPISLNVSNGQSGDFTVYESNSTPSAKLIQALKHENFDFTKRGFEIEANLFFSALWNSYSNQNLSLSDSGSKEEEKFGEGVYDDVSNKSLAGEESLVSITSVDWCHLLPPQSLSSLLLKKKPLSLRERRKSFRILLSAASKAYWEPSPLKTEFAKWRLPCYMDIPLCEIFVDNPILLYKYCPHWIKQRPLIPDPIDPDHPAVAEAGRQAERRARAVNLRHDRQEVGILLRNAIEKVEKDGMRVTGDIISPAGWVVDNMVLDLRVWCILAKANIFPTHVFFLTDSEPDFRRIINTWHDLCHESSAAEDSNGESQIPAAEESSAGEFENENDSSERFISVPKVEKIARKIAISPRINVADLLFEALDYLAKGEEELDKIYEVLASDGEIVDHASYQPYFLDLFSHSLINSRVRNSYENQDEWANEESTLTTVNFSGNIDRILISARQPAQSLHDFPLGPLLQVFTSKVLDILRKSTSPGESHGESPEDRTPYEDGIGFFVLLLTISQRLDRVREWLTASRREIKIVEIDASENAQSSRVFSDLIEEMHRPFGKKPRELEPFEVEEIEEAIRAEEMAKGRASEEPEEETETKEDVVEKKKKTQEKEKREDVRIYGESGPFCIVNLERNILLPGNPEHSLRYYGKLYFFWGREEKSKFLEDPEKYAPYYSPIRCLPPLRIFLLGPFGGEKSSLATAISNQCSIHFVDHIKFLSNKLIPHANPIPSKLRALNDSLLLSVSHNKEATQALAEFQNATHKQKQFWMENPPYYPDSSEVDEKLADLLNLQQLDVHVRDVKLDYRTIDSDLEDPDQGTTLAKANPSEGEKFSSMSDILKMIENYIHGDSDLSDFCIGKTLNLLWNGFPYATNGFVLKDFPMRSYDGRVILKNNWIPDLVIEVGLTEEEAIEGNIDKLMEIWDAKLKRQIAEEQLVEDAVKSIQETKMAIRRMEMTATKEKESLRWMNAIKPSESRFSYKFEKIPKEDRKSSLKRTVNDSSPFEEEKNTAEHEEEIEEILQKEFPVYVFNRRFEDYEDGRARIKEDMAKNYSKDSEEIGRLKSQLKSIRVPWMEISSTQINDPDVFIELNRFKKRIDQRGEFAFQVSPETAERLLRQGYYFLSKFGRLCPVQAYRRKNPVNMFRPLRSRKKIFPVVYRNYVYFVGGENEKTRFLEDPIRYVFGEPRRPNLPLRMSVIGPPKSGKSTLCHRLGSMFDLKVITVGSAIRFVLEEMEESSLKTSIEGYLKRGCFLPLSLKVEALAACINDPACVTQGFVFDGVPYDAATAQSLAEKRILPFVIVSLVGDCSLGRRNRASLDLSRFRLGYRQRVDLERKYEEWRETYGRFVHWNHQTYHNLYEIKADSNLTDLFHGAYEILRKPYFSILDYVENVPSERPLSLEHLCVTEQEYALRKTEFDDNCPVCWKEKGRLKCSIGQMAHRGLVQYRNHFYWTCSSHLEKFMGDPKKYLPPSVPPCPVSLPRAVTEETFESARSKHPIHGFGRCPVTRIDFPDSLEWEGSTKHAALYSGELFLCRNADMLERFLARPWRYSSADSSFEGNTGNKSNAVENLGPPKVTSLPPIGFLEQTVADLIHRCLQVLGSVRPVYPKLSPACTASVFVALYLKVHNKRRNPLPLEREYLDFMFYYCKAYRFRVPYLEQRQPEGEEGQGDFEREYGDSNESVSKPQPEETAQSQSTLSERIVASPEESHWIDLESQADKKLWSAKFKPSAREEMILNSEDELQEIVDVPKKQVVLRYLNLRNSPLPPISNCLTFLYSAKPNLRIPEKFNVNCLYQSPPTFESPYRPTVICNPERQFAVKLFEESPEKVGGGRGIALSRFNLVQEQKIEEEESHREVMEEDEHSKREELIRKRFVPRFRILDVVDPIGLTVPTVQETSSVVFEPRRDYTYTMLMSDFFHTTHVLKCYEWEETKHHFEFAHLIDRGLGLCNVRSRFFFGPVVSPSAKSAPSIESYRQNFEASNAFFYRDFSSGKESSESEEDSSFFEFVRSILLDRLEKMFDRLSRSDLSYDSYETSVLSDEVNAKSILWIREILPFPPLIWDISSRPYYSYCTLFTIFSLPDTENIAHERQVSLLDGIIEPNENFRYVRYPTWVRPGTSRVLLQDQELERKQKSPRPSSRPQPNQAYFVFDFFNLNWTSFLSHSFSMAYGESITDHFQSPENLSDQ